MNLFSELLLTSDHPHARRFDASESRPVSADDCFQRLHNHVTNAGIQVESGKDPFVHSSFDRIASPAVLVYRAFNRIGDEKVPDAKTLARLGPVIEAKAVEQLHERLVKLAQEQGVIRGSQLRVDTTVVETSIH